MHLLTLQIGAPKIRFFASAFFSIGHGHTQQAPRIQGRAIAEVHHVIEGGLAASNGQFYQNQLYQGLGHPSSLVINLKTPNPTIPTIIQPSIQPFNHHPTIQLSFNHHLTTI